MADAIDPERIREFIETRLLAGRSIAMEEDILLSGLVDSLGIMALVAEIEAMRGAPIPPADVTLENFASVAAIAAYLDG